MHASLFVANKFLRNTHALIITLVAGATHVSSLKNGTLKYGFLNVIELEKLEEGCF